MLRIQLLEPIEISQLSTRILQPFLKPGPTRQPFIIHGYVFQRFGLPKIDALSIAVLVPNRVSRWSSGAAPQGVGRDAAVFVRAG